MKCLVSGAGAGAGGGAEAEDVFGARCFGSAPAAAAAAPTAPAASAAPATMKLRPTMISAKYRLKEERRKVLKISIAKLRKIEDPESSLRRSVLINNTMKRLQREAREEKLQKQFPNAKPAAAYRPELTTPPPAPPSPPPQPPQPLRRGADKENAVPDALRQSSVKTDAVRQPTVKLEDVVTSDSAPRKRSFDEVEDCDVQDVLSQFYMPPTPRMLTSIDDTDDEDEDVNVVDIDISGSNDVSLACALQQDATTTNVDVTRVKRPRLDDDDDDDEVVDPLEMLAGLSSGSATGLSAGNDDIDMSLALEVAEAPSTREHCETLCRTFLPSENSSQDSSLSSSDFYPCRTRSDPASSFIGSATNTSNGVTNSATSSTTDQYSCGHSSIFGEIQSVVYHSLITSLES